MAAIATEELAVLAVAPEGDGSPAVTVERFYVAPGDAIMVGDPVCLLRSERYVFDIPATEQGTVLELLAAPGATSALGAPIVRVAPVIQCADVEPEQGRANGAARRATPLARNIAAAHGRDLSAIHGSGAGGRVRAADVRAALGPGATPARDAARPGPAPPVPPPPVASAPPAEAPPLPAAPEPSAWLPRSIVGTDQPRALTAIAVDLLPDTLPRRQTGGRRAPAGLDPTPMVRFSYAVAGALVEHPWLNSRWTDEGVILYGRVDLGIRRVVDGRPTISVIQRAADLSLQGLARKMDEAAQNAAPADRTSGPTFLIVPAGTGAAWWFEPSIAQPSAAVLTIGAATRRPVVVEGISGPTIAVRDRALLALSYDARYIAQPEADAFLRCVRMRVERLNHV